MAIPRYNELYNNVLSELSDEKEYRTRDLKEIIANKLDLTEEERYEMLPSNRSTIINNRIGWAISYLKKAGFVESKKWGRVNITKLGLQSHLDNPNITEDDLLKIPEFAKWKLNNKKPIIEKDPKQATLIDSTPEEEMEQSFTRINDELSELTAYAGNGGIDQLVGIYDESASLDADGEIEYNDCELIEDDPYHFECPKCGEECDVRSDNNGEYWYCEECELAFDEDGYEIEIEEEFEPEEEE